MTQRAASSAFALAMLTIPIAAADTDKLDCTAPQTQIDMTMCAGQDYAAADAQLNAAYRKARAAMQSFDANLLPDQRGAAQALLEAQRAWITFRDAACKAEGYPYYGGTIQPMIVSECLARLTRRRTDDLTNLVQDQ